MSDTSQTSIDSEIDSETADDLISSFDDHYEILQISLNKMMHNTDDVDLINTAFRSIHSIKGNAAMVALEPIINYAHAVEEAMGSMRAGHFTASQTLCELLLTSVDRLRDLHGKYLFNKETVNIDEKGIAEAFTAIANARSAEEIDSLCQGLHNLFTPQKVSESANEDFSAGKGSPISLEGLGQHADYLSISGQQAEDLIFFRILSLQVDAQNNFWDKRTDILLFLALKTASLSNKELDKAQLAAAIYVHDIGMAFVSDDIVNKKARLNTLETKLLQQHSVWSYNLLKRMLGWEAASEMVLSHHERIDGDGYPYKKAGNNIPEGAKLIAIVDVYYAMTHLRADRSHRRSILRAISEINACIDTQFCRYWVELFNQVIREEVKKGTI
jgi:HD-GYP domain-containing protein (c-di-GMP phosphodiesterase class II)